MVELEQVEPWK